MSGRQAEVFLKGCRVLSMTAITHSNKSRTEIQRCWSHEVCAQGGEDVWDPAEKITTTNNPDNAFTGGIGMV